MKRHLWGWMLCCTLSVATLGSAQTATTSLRGTVKDPSGALVPGATITLVNKANGSRFIATSNNTGLYAFPQIEPARYTITISATGFGNQTKTAELLVNQPATVDFTLSVQASLVTVDVSDVAQTLNTSDATLGDSVGNATIEALPMEGRDPTALLTLQPGVLYLGNPLENNVMDSRSGSVSGGRSDQGNITLDGMDDNDQINGTAFTTVLRSTLDSTEEFRVTTSNGQADTGRSSGAQVTMVTKSGTNSLHGALYEYYRPTNTVANNWFNKYAELAQGKPNIPQKYVMNTFGGSLGGPVMKNKLFFFFNYEGQRKAIDSIVTQTLPTQQFYNGELGYLDSSNTAHWLSATQFTSLDADCSTNVTCGVNPNVQAYYQPLAAKGYYGAAPTVGDGLNNAGFIFASPAPSTFNTSIAKIDYSLNSKQHIFFRGNLQKDTAAGSQNLPDQPATSWHEDNTKGMALGHTWTPTSQIVNDLRYAFIRQGYSTMGKGSGTGDWVDFRFLAQPTEQTRSTILSVPVQNIADTFTLTKGSHTMSLGGDWRYIQNNSDSDMESYSSALNNAQWTTNSPNDPSTLGSSFPAVGGGFETSYMIAYDNLVGTVPETTQQYNYKVTGPTSGTLIPDGAFINRDFKSNEFEYFLQDSWRIKPTLTVTYGFRHSILQVPYEANGQEVAPTINMHDWFVKRGEAAAQGDVYEPLVEFMPSGKANHLPGYWAKQKDNIAPRLSAVWAFNPKTTIRAGAGMYYDHFGDSLVNSFSQVGSFGLSGSVTSPASTYSIQTSPRFTGPHNIPPLVGCPGSAATLTYPFAPSTSPTCGWAMAWGIDNGIKTPYSYALDFSLQRELPGGFVAEADYVGRLGRHLLQHLDLATPVNLVDKQSGVDYFTAGAEMSKISDQNGGNANATVAPISYFENMFPYMAGGGESATQNIYTQLWAPLRYSYGETTSLFILDFGDPNGLRYWSPQYSALYGWSSIGTSSYNALQIIVRHPSKHGLTTDFNFTYSKSLDMGSSAERAIMLGTNDAFADNSITNAWNPKQEKGPSDFDTRFLATIDWVYSLPVGRGKAALGNANRAVDALVGGWQWAGLSRWSSGLPFSVFEAGFTTDWQEQSYGIVTSPVHTQRHLVNGIPQVFAGNSATTINNGVYSGSPIRIPYPGEAGQRNNFRGDGYFDIDSSLAKTWDLHDTLKLKFIGEVYNVPNNVRFDVSPINLNASLSSGTFGAYGGMLSTYRRMEFGLRLEF